MKRIFSFSTFLRIILILLLAGIPAQNVRADAALTVNTASDADITDGICSLREAIIAANTDTDYNGCAGSGYGADTITFAANYTITLASQLPAVTSEIIITGKGAANTIVQASTCNPVTLPGGCTPAAYRVFEVSATGDLTLDGLTARHGKTSSGGGVYNNSGTLTVTNSTISGNSATYGGGVRNDGTLTITNSTFSGNGNSASYGGGVRNAGALMITNSTFSGNSALYGGGVESYSGTLTVTNSTFSGNSATYGGGIDNPLLSTATLKNTIVANSTGGDCYGAGAVNADAYNLDSDGSCGDATQKTTVEINLGALADNGGSTQTLALLPPSAAIDAGDDSVCDDNPGPNNLDQRGVTRPQGAHCDIGAFEVQAQSGPAFIVNSSADTDDGLCDDDCTLREAINAANAISGADTITFDANYTITLASQLPVVASAIAITGNGAANTIVQASTCNPVTRPGGCTPAAYRVFEVSGSGNLTLDSLTVRHGNTGYGGGVENYSGVLTIINSTFSGNSASYGGGISNIGILTITKSTFSGNSATYGGGVYNNGTLTITNSTFSGNSATQGGVYNWSGALTITNSTFSGNSATHGGGIENIIGTGTLKNTIVANSTSGGDCAGTITADAYNLDSDGSCGDATQKTTVEINLGALADNGGPTQTLALLPGSAAIEAGDDSVCDDNPGPNNLDQRGVTRPQGAHCDIGAFESTLQTGPAFIVNVNVDTDDGSCDYYVSGLYDCTLREAINAANAISGADTITFADDYTITLASQLPAATSAITITGNGAANTIIQASACNPVTLPEGCTPAAYRVFQVSAGGNLTLDSLTARHGKTSNGGGIYNTTTSTLTVTNSAFSGNSATSGGGIYNQGALTITNSTFSGNSGLYEGGIYNESTLTVTNSTFSGNSASSGTGGGGINNYSALTITNSTFSGNSAPYGGGIRNSAGTVTLKNTIVANSTGGDCFGAITADAYNLDSDGSCGDATQKTSLEINLGALADNGGSTQTFALLPGSAAIDAGDDSVCDDDPSPNNLDQRGVTRPQGAHCDIGAFELEVYTLTITSAHGTVIANPDQVTYHEGDVVQLTSTPSAGWSFANWTGDLTSSVNPDSVTIHGNTSVTANYTQNEYTLTITSAHGTVVANPDQATYHEDDVVQLTATPSAGWSFANWTGDLTSSTNPDTVTIHGNTSVTANYTQNEYTLTVTSDHGAVVKNPDQATYHEGDAVQLTATPSAGWTFANWTGDLTSSVNPDSVTIHGNTAITANYTQNEYTLTITSAHGTVVANPDQVTYHEDDVVQLTATPTAGWTFANWTGDLTSSVNPDSVTIHGNTSVTANYTQNEYTLTIISANGTVVANPNQATYHEGDVVQLTATPNTGWTFANWSGGLTGSVNPDSVIIHGNTSVTANYTQNEYTLTIISANGTVVANPNQVTYHEGDAVQLTSTPNTGWSFSNWTGDLTSSVNPDSVTIHGNTSVTANYTQNEYTLTIISAHGTVVANPNQATYHEGDMVQLTAIPNAGWSFLNWTGGLTGTDNTGFVTIHGNTSVTANYTQNAYTLFLPLILR